MFVLTKIRLSKGILGQKGSGGISLRQMIVDTAVSFLRTEVGIWSDGVHNDFAVGSSKRLNLRGSI